MRNFFILSLTCLLAFSMYSCDKDDAEILVDESNPEEINNGSSSTENGSEEVILPMDKENLKFIGEWNGVGMRNLKSVVNGTWYFYNDSTYEFIGKIDNIHDKGKWHYNAEKKWLITDHEYSCIWEVAEISENNWIGTFQNSHGGTYSYARVTRPLSCETGLLTDINENDVTIAYTIKNIEFAAENYQTGIYLSTSKDMEPGTLTAYTGTVTKDGMSAHLTGMTLNTTYYYCAFIKTETQEIYGDTLKYIHHYYDDAVFLGSYSKNNTPLFWAVGNMVMKNNGTAYIDTENKHINQYYNENLSEWDKYQWADETGMKTEETNNFTAFYSDDVDISSNYRSKDLAYVKLNQTTNQSSNDCWRLPTNDEFKAMFDICIGSKKYDYSKSDWICKSKLNNKSIEMKTYYTYHTYGSKYEAYYWTSNGKRTRVQSPLYPATYTYYGCYSGLLGEYSWNPLTHQYTSQCTYNLIRPVRE